MGKQGHGIGKGKPKMKDRHIGRALIRQQERGGQGLNGLDARANAAESAKKSLHTVLDTSGLDDFVDYIEMEGKKVDVHRVKSDADAAFLIEGTTATTPNLQSMNIDQYEYEHLPVPRKPAWSRSMTAEQVDENERIAFVNWRRRIAELEEANQRTYRATPFEKNIEVWRQLWRVLERSDMAIQVVDARNPLLYFTGDLVSYASEHDPPRPMMIVLNKSDFLTEYQRIQWSRHLDSLGIKYVFYSAHKEQKKVDALASVKAAQSSRTLSEDEEAGIEARFEACDKEEVVALMEDLCSRFQSPSDDIRKSSADEVGSDALERMEHDYTRSRVLTRAELVMLLTELPLRLQLKPQDRHDGRACIGMVGFPNVGKSSCINSIMGVSKSTHGKTRVAVSSTPGKTKHFQTLMVSDRLMLCDCPGLVFPSFMRSTGEMLCAGILPINQMRTYVDPATVITSRVPQHLLDATYGITIRKILDVKDNPSRPPTGSEMLEAYCRTKGYITGGTGRWDEFRACKEIIRDFCDGVLLHVCPPDGTLDQGRWLHETEKTILKSERVRERLANRRLKEATSNIVTAGTGATAAVPSVFGPPLTAGTGTSTEPQFVFGDGKYDDEDEDDGGSGRGDGAKDLSEAEAEGGLEPVAVSVPAGTVFDDESSDEEDSDGSSSAAGAGGAPAVVMGADGSKPKREHKKLRHWGKKNKKLKEKDPYGEDSGAIYHAYTTNRAGGAVPVPGKGRTSAMRSTRAVYKTAAAADGGTTGGGAAFTRQKLPHHPTRA